MHACSSYPKKWNISVRNMRTFVLSLPANTPDILSEPPNYIGKEEITPEMIFIP